MMMDYREWQIILWNMRGVVNKRGQRHVRELVCKHNPDAFIVLETPGNSYPIQQCEMLWDKLSYQMASYVDAVGHFGGVWILMANNTSQCSLLIVALSV